MKNLLIIFVVTSSLSVAGCQNNSKQVSPENITQADTVPTKISPVVLPAPFATPSAEKYCKVIGWPADKMPVAPAGFTVTKFADSLNNPRWIYVAGNGDIFVSQSTGPKSKGENADCILRFSNIKDGLPQNKSVYLKGLKEPFGMLIIGNKFYVANTDAVVEYPYDPTFSSIISEGKKIISLPANGRHWTRNIISNAKGDKIFISIGSSSNVAENGIDKEARRACILEINTDGSGEKMYASGLRNPVGMGWAPGTQALWTAVNERDELGDELVPDYMTSIKEGGFYGWPYCYFGQHVDPRVKDKQPDLVNKAIVPDVALGVHTASLGLAFYEGKSFPEKYSGGAFVGQHGSWNRSIFVGYKVVFVPFKNGKPNGHMEDFLTGFIADESKNEVYGRPVGVAVLNDGSLLVADDAGNTLWRVQAK